MGEMNQWLYDSSQLGDFLDCPLRWYYRYDQKLQKVKEDAYDQPKFFGNALHKGREAQYKGYSPQAVQDVFLAHFPTALSDQETLYRPENGVLILNGYRQWSALNDQEWELVAVEEPGQFDLVLGIPFLVKPDLILKTPGGYFAEDFKSTRKSLGEDYWRQFEMSGQVTAQAAYVEQTYGQCSGVFITGCQVGYRSRKYREEAPGFHYTFQRQLFNRSATQIANWKDRTRLTIQRLEATKQSGWWEQNTRQCQWCAFNQLCQSVNDENVRSILYETHDPYAYLKKEIHEVSTS